MSLIQVREKAQITIPNKIRKELGIKKGDYLEVAREDDRIVIIPKILIEKVSVNLSMKGEEMLKEAIDDVKKGKVKIHNNPIDLINDLHK
ncbi:MAG TPA: AbrB/MazE/SpoVT family DNA-binding domain-containing protein [Candidatus Atribacteria bacterium]|nr:AbrB/MazE/SpoVT family DNA-binding domain-containing protein [Candidatus Atribacteria bacterium]